jgi:hypothetical protein
MHKAYHLSLPSSGLLDLLNFYSTGYCLRNLCDRVKNVDGTHICHTIDKVERNKHDNLLDGVSDTDCVLDLSTETIIFTISPFLMSRALASSSLISAHPVDSSRSRSSDLRVMVSVCQCQMQRPVVSRNVNTISSLSVWYLNEIPDLILFPSGIP